MYSHTKNNQNDNFRLFLCVLGQFIVWIHSVKFGEDSSLEPRAGRLSSFPGDGDGNGAEQIIVSCDDEYYDKGSDED